MYFLAFAAVILFTAAFPFLPASVPLWVQLLVPFVLFWIIGAIVRRTHTRRLENEATPLIQRYEATYGSLDAPRRSGQAQQIVARFGEGFGEGYAEAAGDLWGVLIGVGISTVSKLFGEYQNKSPEQRQLEAQITSLLSQIRSRTGQYRRSVVGAGLACLVVYGLTEGGTFPVQRLTAASQPVFSETEREQRVCDRGDGNACLALGRRQASQAPSEAVRLFQTACDHGNSEGCLELGQSHAQGLGTSEDLEAALAAYQRGCEKANGAACERIGALHRDGKAASTSRTASIAALDHACAVNTLVGCTELARLLLDGQGPRAERKRGIELLRRACKEAQAPACAELAHYTKKPRRAAPANTLLAKRHDGLPEVSAGTQQQVVDTEEAE